MTERKVNSELLFCLADMVAQNCRSSISSDPDVYETGFISTHKEAMQLLVKHKVMVEVRDGFGRGYWAKFTVPNDPAQSVSQALRGESHD